VLRPEVVVPATLQIRLHGFPVPVAIIRVLPGDVTELIRRTNLVVRAIGETRRRGLIGFAVHAIVIVRILVRRFRGRLSSPPTTDDTSEAADQHSDRTRECTDRRARGSRGCSANALARELSCGDVIVANVIVIPSIHSVLSR